MLLVVYSFSTAAYLSFETEYFVAGEFFSHQLMKYFQRIIETVDVNIDCKDFDGRESTPLHFAAGYNRVEVLEYLLEKGADIEARDTGYTNFTSSSDYILMECMIADIDCKVDYAYEVVQINFHEHY